MKLTEFIVMFLSGISIALSLSLLLPHDLLYQTTWFKIQIACGIAIFGILTTYFDRPKKG